MSRGVGLFFVLSYACGGSGSGVPSSKKVSEITTSDAMSICNAHKDQVGIEAVCTLTAAGLSSSKADCETQRDACKKDPATQASLGTQCKDANASDLKDCSGTVGELESCLDSFSSYVNGVSCAQAAKLPTPPACAEKCPALFGGASSSGTGSSGSSGSAGAGGSGGTGGSSTSSGSTKKLSDVTASELVSLCEANRSKLDAIAAAGCTTDGLGANSKAECVAARDACLQTSQGSSSVDCTSSSTSDLVGCSATIGQFTACIDSLATFFDGLSCDNYNLQPPPVPACFNSLSMECPSLFGM